MTHTQIRNDGVTHSIDVLTTQILSAANELYNNSF